MPPAETQSIIRELQGHEEPTIAYDRIGIKRELDLLQSHLHRAVRDRLQVSVLFSVKANPNQDLLKWFVAQGVGAEVSSMVEFDAAQRAGMRLISATSPGLSVSNISTLRAHGVRLNIDNPTQLRGVPAKSEVGLRLCTPLDLTSESGAYSRFGMMLDDPLLREALQTYGCTVVRIHGHFRDIGNAAQLRSLANRLVVAARHFPDVNEINLGGGMTRLYKDPGTAGEAWEECAPIFDDLPSNNRILVEPGAQLLTGHGYLAARVVSVTERSDGRRLVVIDASRWNLVCWSEYKLIFPEATDEEMVADVVGPTCYEKDVWITGARLPKLHPGQQLVFQGLGAYVASMARRMHGLPLPKEILL